MTRPVVAVVAAPGRTEALRPLVRALSRHVEVRAADRAPAADAYLVAGASALGAVPDGAPVALAEGGRVTVGGWAIDLGAGPVVDTSAWPPLAPHVRGRWRERLGLPADLVVETGDLAGDDVPTALAVAAAAVVADADVPLALALGCPSVVSAAVAATLGAEDGVHVVVGGRPEAVALGADAARAARTSRLGHELARRRDPARAAQALLGAWGLAPTGLTARFDERLAELGTAPAGPIRRRIADALEPLSRTAGPITRPAPGGP